MERTDFGNYLVNKGNASTEVANFIID